MKKLLIASLVLIFVVSYSAQAQSRNSLKGPAAKNYKPWKNTESSSTQVVIAAEKEVKKGPAAKNEKVWERKSANTQYVAVDSTPKTKLMGPAAKNRKVWESNQSSSSSDIARKAKEQKETSN